MFEQKIFILSEEFLLSKVFKKISRKKRSKKVQLRCYLPSDSQAQTSAIKLFREAQFAQPKKILREGQEFQTLLSYNSLPNSERQLTD